MPAFGAVHNYTVSVSDDLASVTVTAQLARATTLHARSGNVSTIRELRSCDGEALNARGQRIDTGTHRCVRYTARLAQLEERFTPTGVLSTTPRAWLWLPMLRSTDRVELKLTGPGADHTFLPFRRAGEAYEITASPGSGQAIALFGDFHQDTIEVGEARLPVAYVGPASERDKISTWLTQSVRNVWGVAGDFPNPHASIIVLDVPGRSGEPVPFGHVIRDAGETVRFFVQAERPLQEMVDDWTATHEFAHLLLPYVRDKWISEGFASYYQNVLLARQGIYTEQRAWQKLVGAFAQARDTRWPPSPNGTRNRPFWEVRMLIYWSGAALALMGDVESRATSDNVRSLDSILAQLNQCCLPGQRSWSAHQLLTKLDELGGGDIFSTLYNKHADAAGLPPVERLYADLGIDVVSGRVRLDDTAPLAHIRRAIMSGEQGEHIGRAGRTEPP